MTIPRASTITGSIGAALAGIAIVCSALTACTSTTPDASGGIVPGTSRGPGDTLRDFAPDGFVIGNSVAGGGHHLKQDYPDPFPNDTEYREMLAAEFGSLTPENQLKWEFVHPERDVYAFDAADAIVEFAEEHGQAVRGHTLLWHSQNPGWLEQGDFTPGELRDILHEHISTVVGRYAGRIAQWDVANEIFDERGELRTQENIWLRELGPGIIADAFRWAHEADPGAVLFLNDYGVESAGPKTLAYEGLVRELLAEGVPVGGFGIQGHLSLDFPFPAGIEDTLRRFADLGLATAITELDVRMTLDGGEPDAGRLERQADAFSRMLDACLAVEGCDSFTLWGTPDPYSWVPVFFAGEGAATAMGEGFTLKPAYCALQAGLAEASGTADDPAFAARACSS